GLSARRLSGASGEIGRARRARPAGHKLDRDEEPLHLPQPFPPAARRRRPLPETMMSAVPEVTDVAIIRARPVGLLAVFECGILKRRCQAIDALAPTGGQCAAPYPEKPIYDIPGHPRIDAADLIHQLELQAAPFRPAYHLAQQVDRLERRGGGWLLETAAGHQIAATAVIIPAGVGPVGPHPPPPPGIGPLRGRHRLYPG